MGSWDTIIDIATRADRYARLGLDAVPQIVGIVNGSCVNPNIGTTEIRCQCPFHQSDDGVSQTLRINLDSAHRLGIGFFKCYSCQTHGHFNDLAEKLGVDMIMGEANPEIRNILIPLRQQAFDYQGAPRFGMEDLPADFSWDRGKGIIISSRAFNIVQAQLWHTRTAVWKSKEKVVKYVDQTTSEELSKVVNQILKGPDNKPIFERWQDEDRIWMPVIDRDAVVAHVAALIGKRHWFSKKYLNAKGEWPKRYIWPLDQIMLAMRERRYVVIVEGPADALRLIDNGIPAIANLGVSAWTSAKAEIISAHYQRVFVCMDPDSAGAGAQKQVIESFAGSIPAHAIRLPKKVDPASFTPQQLEKFKRLIQGEL
jgi:5S rRNA maturation endonuclease (ribonuclease M5)